MIVPGQGVPPFNPGNGGGGNPFFPPQRPRPPPFEPPPPRIPPIIPPPDEPPVVIIQQQPPRNRIPDREPSQRNPTRDYDYEYYDYEDPINNEVDVFSVEENFQTNDPFLCN